MKAIGKIIGGSVSEKVIIRLHSDSEITVGDMLYCTSPTKNNFFLKVVNMNINSLIGSQFIEDMAGQKLEYEHDYNLFDQKDRFFRTCEAKLLKIFKDEKLLPPRALPNFFDDVYVLTPEHFKHLSFEGEIPIGNLRIGTSEVEEIKIALPANKLIAHHILVVAATGKGKSNFAKVFLRGMMNLHEYSSIVFDPHNEYYGGTGIRGLRDHPNREKILYFTPKYEMFPGSEQLKIHTSDLEPEDFFGIIDLSSAQQEAMTLIYRELGEEWVKTLMEIEIEELVIQFGQKIQNATFATLKRKIKNSLEIRESSGLVFDLRKREGVSLFEKIKNAILLRKIIIIDNSMVSGETEKIITSSIVNRTYDFYRNTKQSNPEHFNSFPEIMILFEEAPRVLGKEALANGTNVFEKIAREGRKFKIGLCAVTQMPSLIPREILSQMNTKIILGLPAPEDRMAIVNSATQNISDEMTEIQMLDRGEAIITSPFIPFPIPVKIFDFNKQLKEDSEKIKPKQVSLNMGFG